MFQTASTLANAVCTQLHGFLGDNSGGLESVVHLKLSLCGLCMIGRVGPLLCQELSLNMSCPWKLLTPKPLGGTSSQPVPQFP